MRRREILTLLGGAAIILHAAVDAAGVFPNRPIKLIVPYPPGDIVGRVLGDKLNASLGRPIVIDNRDGAGAVLGTLGATSRKVRRGFLFKAAWYKNN